MISYVEVTLDGCPVSGINGLVTDIATGKLWGIFRQSNVGYLGTVHPITGVVTSVGALPDDFEGITYVPEPGSTAALGAGVIALGLCAMHRRRRVDALRRLGQGIRCVDELAS